MRFNCFNKVKPQTNHSDANLRVHRGTRPKAARDPGKVKGTDLF